MKTILRTAAAAALLLSVGVASQAQARAYYGSGATPPSTSHTVMGLSVPR